MKNPRMYIYIYPSLSPPSLSPFHLTPFLSLSPSCRLQTGPRDFDFDFDFAFADVICFPLLLYNKCHFYETGFLIFIDLFHRFTNILNANWHR